MSIVGAGALLLFFGSDAATVTAPHPAEGNVLALLSGLTWALTITGLRWAGKRNTAGESAAATVIAGNVIAFAACLPLALPLTQFRAADAGVILYLGIFQIGLAYFALTRSIRHVPALESSMLLLVEPVFNPVWTWLIHGEKPGMQALCGGLLVIAATSARLLLTQRDDRTDIRRTPGPRKTKSFDSTRLIAGN